MHVLISSARPSAALVTNAGSARNGRAIDTMSASPRAMMSSATAGSLMRLVAISGIETAPFKRRVTHANAARGTMVAIVGMRASCQPMPVLMIVAPAALDEIEHRQPVDDDELRAHGLARAAHDRDRKAHAIEKRAAPLVIAKIGLRRDELIDEVTLGT